MKISIFFKARLKFSEEWHCFMFAYLLNVWLDRRQLDSHIWT